MVESSTAQSGAAKLRKHVAPRWDDVPLNEISTVDVQAWVRALGRSGLAASTVRGCYFILSASLRAAVHEGLISSNPCSTVRLPTLPPEPERYLRDEEVDALLRHLRGPYRVLAEILLESGMRIGEAVVLHRNRIDFETRRITVIESWERDQHLIRPHSKGGHARSVPMSDRLEAVLLEWLGRRPREDGCGFVHAPGSTCHSELVVVGPSGAVIDPGNFTTRVFAKALRDAGIGHARVHDLRHTWASRLVTASVPIQWVQKWAGHGSLQPTQRYARLMDDGDTIFRSALGGREAARAARQEAEREANL